MASNVELQEFKDYIGTELSRNDANLQQTLDAAESAVFQHLRRRVVAVEEDAEPSTRLFVPTTRWYVETDDFTELDSVSDGDWELTSEYYQLEPLNGLSSSGEYRPYSVIRRSYSEWFRRDRDTATVSVSAIWGWSSVPEAIPLATMMVGKDLRSAKDTAFGIAAYTEQAGIRIRENPTVLAMLRDYRKDPVMIA